MSKEELIEKLINLGYKAQMISGIPYILDVDVEVARDIIRGLNYNETWAVRVGNDFVSFDVLSEKEDYLNENDY